MSDETPRFAAAKGGGAWSDGASLPGAASVVDWGGGPAPSSADHPFGTDERARYEAEGLLGRGGMGHVTLVRDHRLNRRVALKASRPEVDGSVARDRLSQEAWITAQLEHPGIVPIYDAGTRSDGTLYYTMRLIRGRSLADALGDAPTLAGRLGLLRHYLDVCEAVGYAHAMGLVHRDLKPANVMVGEFGETQVVDWGLARPVGADDGAWRGEVLPDEHAALTRVGDVVGTPMYMSPEQARGGVVDQRSDVWSLGIVLCELLAGGPPFADRPTEAVLTALRAGAAPPPMAERLRRAPRELVAIVRRATAPEPSARYPSAKALAEDVARYLDGRPVEAYHYTLAERAARWLRAYQLPVVVGMVALALLVVVIAVAWLRTAGERDRALTAEAAARQAEVRAEESLGRALVEQARVAAEAKAPPEAEILAGSALVRREDPLARGILASLDLETRPRLVSRLEAPRCTLTRISESGERLLCISDGVSLWTTDGPRRLWHTPVRAEDGVFLAGVDRVVIGIDDHALAVLDASTGEVLVPRRESTNPHPFVSSSRGRYAAVFAGGQLEIHDVEGGTRTLDGCTEEGLVTAALSRDDRWIALACGDGRVVVSALAEASVAADDRLTFGAPDRGVVSAMSFSADAQRLAVGTLDGEVALVDRASGRVVRRAQGANRPIAQVRLSPDGELLVVTGEHDGPQLWDTRSGAWVGRLPASAGNRARFVGARELLTLGESIQRWRLPEDPPPPRRFLAPEGLSSVAVSPDGGELALARGDGVLSLREMTTGETLADLAWQTGVVKDAAFSREGDVVASAGVGEDGIRLFDARSGAAIAHLGTLLYRRVGVLRGGAVVGLPYTEGVHVFAPGATRPDAEVLAASTHPFVDLAVGAGGANAVVVADNGGGVWRLTADTPVHISPILPEVRGTTAAVSGDGRVVAIGGRRGVRVFAWDTDDDRAPPRLVRALERPEGRVVDVALTADGALLAVAEVDGSVRLSRVSDGAVLGLMEGHAERVSSVVFTDDGSVLVSASWDGTARRWDLAALTRPAEELLRAAETTWGARLEDVLRRR